MSTIAQERIADLERKVAELESDPHQVAQKQLREQRAREQASREKQLVETMADFARAQAEILALGPSLDKAGKLHAFVNSSRVSVGEGSSLPCPHCEAPFAQGGIQSLSTAWRGARGGSDLSALVLPTGRPWLVGIPAFYLGETCSSCGNSSTVFAYLVPLG